MLKKKKHLTSHATSWLTDEEIDQHILDLLPTTQLEIYAYFGAAWYAAKKTKKRVRDRLNALTDEEKIYAKGHIGALTYHKKEKPLTAYTTARMTEEEIDQHILDLLDISPTTRSEIYAYFGAGWISSRKTKKRVRSRLNALEDKGDIYTKGSTLGLTYHKKEKRQENI